MTQSNNSIIYQGKTNAFLCLNGFVVIRAAECRVPGEAGRVAKQLYIPPANSHYLLIIIKSNWTEGFYIQYIHFDLIWPDQAVNRNYKI